MRAIRKVAATQRAVICTIHQPSTYLFEMFDALLLLKKGGQTVFFGDLGESSLNLISYLEVTFCFTLGTVLTDFVTVLAILCTFTHEKNHILIGFSTLGVLLMLSAVVGACFYRVSQAQARWSMYHQIFMFVNRLRAIMNDGDNYTSKQTASIQSHTVDSTLTSLMKSVRHFPVAQYIYIYMACRPKKIVSKLSCGPNQPPSPLFLFASCSCLNAEYSQHDSHSGQRERGYVDARGHRCGHQR